MVRSFFSKAISTLIVLAVAGLLVAEVVWGANASLLVAAPATAMVSSVFTVRVYVATTQAINAAEATLLYPTDLVTPISAGSAGSVIDLWIQEPKINPSNATVSGSGLVLDPGYVGSGGTIFTAQFRAKNEGAAKFSVVAGNLLANDGSGTSVVTVLGATTVKIMVATAQAPTPTGAVREQKQETVPAPVPVPVLLPATAPETVSEAQLPAETSQVVVDDEKTEEKKESWVVNLLTGEAAQKCDSAYCQVVWVLLAICLALTAVLVQHQWQYQRNQRKKK